MIIIIKNNNTNNNNNNTNNRNNNDDNNDNNNNNNNLHLVFLALTGIFLYKDGQMFVEHLTSVIYRRRVKPQEQEPRQKTAGRNSVVQKQLH
jgi:hypothetical protein